MRHVVSILLCVALCVAAWGPANARANPAFLAAESFNVSEVAVPLPADAKAPLWDSLPAAAVAMVPQETIHLNDRVVNEELASESPRTATLRAAMNDRDLAIVIEWADPTEDRVRTDETIAFGDSAALALPQDFGAGKRLPYIGMGDDALHVVLYLQRAVQDGVLVREAIAAGFGSSTRADLGGMRPAMRYDAAKRKWRAVFVRPLAVPGHDLRQGLVPFAIAVWDGARRERGGNKSLSSWKFLRLGRLPLDARYVSEMSFGYNPGDLGDAAVGKQLAESVCIACHRLPGRAFAPLGLAPDLSSIGAVASAAYLRDSILNPSAIVVPNPNVNQHYNKAGPADANGALPNNDQFIWFTRDPAGKKVSKMPPLAAGYTKEQVAGLVAFLKSLGVAPAATGDRRP